MSRPVFKRSASLGAALAAVLGSGCPLDDSEVPVFGRACTESAACGDAYLCRAGFCVPADAVEDPDPPDGGPDPVDEVVVEGDLHAEQFADHPGVTRVTGDVLVTSSTALDLAPLVSLAKIEGSLKVTGNEALSRASLPALTTVNGDVVISQNAALSRIEAPFLQTARLVQIDNNAALIAVDLQRLASTTGDVRFFNDDVLSALALPELATVGGALELGFAAQDPEVTEFDSLIVVGNAVLESAALPKLTSVAAHLHVVFNEALETVDFSALASVGSELRVDGNTQLTALSLPLLTSVGVGVFVTGNGIETLELPALEELTGSTGTAFTDVFGPDPGELRIDSHEALTTVSAPLATSLSGGLSLIANPALTTVDAPVLATLGGLFLVGNDALTAWPLPALTTCCAGKLMQIDGNGFTTLPALTGGAGPRTIDGDVLVGSSEVLTTVPFFSALTSIDGDLTLRGLTSVDLVGFQALETVTGTLELNNVDVVDLSGFRALLHLGKLTLTSCDELEHLSGPTFTNETFTANASRELTGDLELNDLDALLDLPAFEGVTVFPGRIELSRVNAGINLAGFADLQTIGTEATRSRQVLEMFATNQVEFPGLLEVNGDVRIHSVTAAGLGFQSLRVVHGDLTIDDNLAPLTSFCGFARPANQPGGQGLRVEGALVINNNDGLTSLDGLEGIAVDGTTSITNNPALETCAVRDFQTRHAPVTFSGNKTPAATDTCAQPVLCTGSG